MDTREYAIEFVFDTKTETRILKLYEQLERSGFGLPDYISDYHPHITLNVCTIHDLNKLESALITLATECTSFPLELSHLGAFLAPQPVVFLAPTVTQKLFDIHNNFIEQTSSFISPTRAYYQPDKWVPHCTLAFDFDLKELPDIMRLCSSLSLPIQAKLESIALVEVSQGHKIIHKPLS